MREDLMVPVEKLKKECDLSIFEFSTTKEIDSTKELIGQERAMKALKFGLSVKKKGYNIYVSGSPGVGKNSYSYSIAKEFARTVKTPNDWCYVFNFEKPENPRSISLKAGDGCYLKKEVEALILKLRTEIPKAFSSKEYSERKSIIYHQYEKRVERVISELNDIGEQHGFIFKQTDEGLITVPLIDGRAMKEEELELLSEEDIDKLKQDSTNLISESYDIIKKIRRLEEQLKNKVKQLNEKFGFDIVEFYVNPLVEKLKGNEEVEKYLLDLEDDIIKNIDEFINKDKVESSLNILKGKKEDDFFKRYDINLFIDNCNKKGVPVIRETNPNYYNLLGKIEYVNELGVLKTDHTKIRSGSIHEANGGYLIIQAKDILSSLLAWEGLKRALSENKVVVENINKGDIVAATIKPEAIPIDLKVIIIGDHYTYQILYNYDDDFKKLFRIRADFDIEMERSEDNIKKFASFVANHCDTESLKEFDKEAISKVIEYSSRLSESQKRLTARFNDIVEVLYEADAWAEVKGANIVSGEHIGMAISEKIHRNNKYEEKLHDLFEDGTIIIDTNGWKVGEINGLAVMDSGQYTFGKPNKITVSTYVGKDGIINIEREAHQSGSIHDKGILILSGYIGEKFARNRPLSLSASITFEQSYDMIDGDSASSTELYAILSNLAELPINQAIAVTGSVNQKGMIQPIGGVNEKIEGFYRVCKHKGLKGGEGVIIPYQNIENLMLNDEIIEAVRESKFTIYAIKTIDEGIEILTEVPAGKKDERGSYPIGTVNYLVQKKLDSYANISKAYD